MNHRIDAKPVILKIISERIAEVMHHRREVALKARVDRPNASHARLCPFAVTGGMCDCGTINPNLMDSAP